MNSFFDDLGQRLARAAAGDGTAIEAPTLDPDVARELLELARVVAHGGERRFAPLSTFMAGIAAERLRVASGVVDPQRAAQLIRQVREALEQEAEARSEP